MRRNLTSSQINPQAPNDKQNVGVTLSRVEAELGQVSTRQARLLRREKKQEKNIRDMLNQLSERHAATLRHLAAREAEIDKKLAELSKIQKEILNGAGDR
jgi:chromosome segregation ATPase